ncbi:MAG: tetraacyldisaccharide 4'-kinase [Pseudomonadota bacterium]
MRNWLYNVWYHNAPMGWVLWPLEMLFRAVAALRRLTFRWSIQREQAAPVPVIIVGNISVGGSGKSPLVAWLTNAAQERGLTPAIISRGYGGDHSGEPLRVTEHVAAADCGDEALMLFQHTGAIVFVSRHRVAAARAAAAAGANVIISDDGLQHYHLARDVEIAVVDARVEHGNGHCLPRGPLREPISRLQDCDLVVYASLPAGDSRIGYRLQNTHAVNAQTGGQEPLEAFAQTSVHALAGIGHPQRFFEALRAHGLNVEGHAIADHALAPERVLHPADELPVLMTAKDAVKYTSLTGRHWIVPASVELSEESRAALLAVLPLTDAQ